MTEWIVKIVKCDDGYMAICQEQTSMWSTGESPNVARARFEDQYEGILKMCSLNSNPVQFKFVQGG